MKSAIILTLILLAGVSSLTSADAIYDGVDAYAAGNYTEALALFRLSAEQGDAAAQLLVGLMYLQGRGVPQDYAQAASWFRKAAEQGDAEAQTRLGYMYSGGQGVPQDDAQAVSWYRKAAEQGTALAQGALGEMYAQGEGVPRDYVLAHMWFNLASANGDELGAAGRDLIAELMTPAQIAEAQKLAREWKPTPAN